VPDGEFLALMGPSGSGKTTILNLVGGLDRADSGEVIVGGEHLETMSGGQLAKWRSRHVGFIFQFYNLMPMLSAAGNVELPLLLTNLSRAERKRHVAVALEMVGLSNREAHKPGEMSGGQQQRVGIARAIVTDPSILLCDEPTGDLDRATADEILKLLQDLNRQQKKTIVMVTHDPKAADFATRHVDVDKGQLVERRVG
jgi:putative ABC transport system ATP-binding protein